MPFHIIESDITLMKVDAIVNAANNTLLGGGGVDGAIHRAAGPGLLEECRGLNGCETGKAKITKGYNLPAKYVIHTVGPVYQGIDDSDEILLRSCYKSCLEIAKSNNLESLAFPLISAGAYRYPYDKALSVASEEIISFLKDNEMDVTICVYHRSDIVTRTAGPDIDRYIFRNYRDVQYDLCYPSPVIHCDMEYSPNVFAQEAPAKSEESAKIKAKSKKTIFGKAAKEKNSKEAEPYFNEPVFENLCLDSSSFRPELDESFSDMLMRKIDEKGIKDSECYFKANVDRRLFSKIRSNRDYRPSKETAVAFAIALELDMNEADEMLRKAGYAFSDSFMFDVIVKYYIENRRYNIFEINETLFSYDQKTI